MRIKHVRPVLVESETYSDLILCAVDNYLHKTEHYGLPMESSAGKDTYQQLILISLEPEKIEFGEPYLDDCGLIRMSVTNDKDYWDRRPNYHKIIATQSQLSPEYILQFIEEYNKKEVKDIEIEMEYFENDTSDCIGMDGEPNGTSFNGY